MNPNFVKTFAITCGILLPFVLAIAVVQIVARVFNMLEDWNGRLSNSFYNDDYQRLKKIFKEKP